MLTASQHSILKMQINKVIIPWHKRYLKHTKCSKRVVIKTIKQIKIHKWLNSIVKRFTNKIEIVKIMHTSPFSLNLILLECYAS